MSNRVFDFPFHTQRTSYPDSTTRVQLGKSWVYAVKPDAPDQRTFTLKFPGMAYFTNALAQVDETILPQRNAAALEHFYRDHLCWDTFTYVHPVYGPLTCRFNKPVELPEGVVDGNGLLESFEIELIEVP